jgi:hypothetical protein
VRFPPALATSAENANTASVPLRIRAVEMRVMMGLPKKIADGSQAVEVDL